MDIPRPPLELFFPTPITPTPLDLRYQDLISSVWIWTEQMKKNQKSAKLFSPILKKAFFAYSEVVDKLECVLQAFYFSNTTDSSSSSLSQQHWDLERERDLDDLEAFVRIICADDGTKLQLHNVDGKIIMIFPPGSPFIAEQIMLDIFADSRIDEKITKLNDEILQSSFQTSIRTYLEFVKEICSTHQSLQKAFNEDQRKLNLKCQSWDIQYREMEYIRIELVDFPRNNICRDMRITKMTGGEQISIAAALDWVGDQKAQFRRNIQLYHSQTHFNDQLCRYLELEVPASLDDLSV